MKLIIASIFLLFIGCSKKETKQIEIITTNDIYIDYNTGDTIKIIRHRPQFGMKVEQWNYVSEQSHDTIAIGEGWVLIINDTLSDSQKRKIVSDNIRIVFGDSITWYHFKK